MRTVVPTSQQHSTALTGMIRMNTMTCNHCQQPVKRYDAALRSISLELVAFHPACLEVELAVNAVFADPAVVVAAHSERVA